MEAVNRFRKNKLSSGLTLTELLIVIVIIAILILLMMLFLRAQLIKGHDAKRKADIKRISVAIEEYEKDNNCYPDYVVCGNDPNQPIASYLSDVPCDPSTDASYYYDIDTSSECSKWYRLSATLENSNDEDAQSYCGPGGIYNFYQGSPNSPDCQFTQKVGRYGCKSGSCVSILWDNSRPGWSCDPNYGRADCYGQCDSSPCVPWR